MIAKLISNSASGAILADARVLATRASPSSSVPESASAPVRALGRQPNTRPGGFDDLVLSGTPRWDPTPVRGSSGPIPTGVAIDRLRRHDGRYARNRLARDERPCESDDRRVRDRNGETADGSDRKAH